MSFCALIVANRNVLLPESQKMRLIYKVIWILQNITYATAPQVTIVYWDINYDGKQAKYFVHARGNISENGRVGEGCGAGYKHERMHDKIEG